jgi:hypothetical protein
MNGISAPNFIARLAIFFESVLTIILLINVDSLAALIAYSIRGLPQTF